jgi:hypothetical protein
MSPINEIGSQKKITTPIKTAKNHLKLTLSLYAIKYTAWHERIFWLRLELVKMRCAISSALLESWH